MTQPAQMSGAGGKAKQPKKNNARIVGQYSSCEVGVNLGLMTQTLGMPNLKH